MDPTLSMAVQIGLLIVPIFVFVFAKKIIQSAFFRLLLGLVLATAAGVAAYELAADHDWHPLTRTGVVVPLGPAALFLIHAGVLMLVFCVMTFAKRKDA